MIIHDPEAFESWLTTTLEPLCDADPAALAKYVFALVKKEKPVPELRATMVKQLDVFLTLETKPFVERLFKTLETQVYESPAPKPPLPKTPAAVPPPPPEVLPPKPPETLPPSQPPTQRNEVHSSQLPLAYQPVNGTVSSRRREDRSRSRQRKPEPEKEADKGRRRHGSPPPSRGRSRSKSWDRSRRSRSRDREREMRRERDRSRAWRNKSPPPRRAYDRERRRSWSNSPGDPLRNHSRSRSRSPRPMGYHRGRYRNRSPPGGMAASRSRTPDTKKEPISGSGTPTQDSNHGDVDMRLTTTSQSIQSVVGKAEVAVPVAATGTFVGKGRCYDFDEKGYCMQGDLCQFDHGVDPVVLEDVALSKMLTFGPTPPPPGTGVGPLPRQPTVPNSNPPLNVPPPRPRAAMQPFHQHRAPPPANMEYNPDAPSMEPRGMTWAPRPHFRGGGTGGHGRGAMRGPRPMQHYHAPPPQRELISVPVQGEEPYQPGYGRGGYNHMESKEMGSKKRMFDFNRLGPRHKTPHNCSLELKKVPRGLNNITHLNNHFAKFGKIVNIQVSYENDPEAALVTFSSHAEANAAYRSTEAVLNNRFIKVFWHTSNNSNNNNNNINNEASKQVQENVPPARQSVKERLGAPSGVNHLPLNALPPKQEQEPEDKVVIDGGIITKTLYIPTALKKAGGAPVENKANTAAAVKRSQDMLEARVRIKRLQQSKQKDTLKLSMNLRKRKQDLLAEQLKQLKVMIERVEKGGVSGDQKEGLMTTMKTMQTNIEKLKKDLAGAPGGVKVVRPMVAVNRIKTNVMPMATSTPVAKTKEQAQREILDAELDLYTRQQEGGDTSELQRKVNELKVESMRLHGLAGTPRGRGRGGMRGSFRGRVRASYNAALSSVDHRPTRVLVSGYENDEKAEVITHFRQYGEIVEYMCDDATPSVILNYRTRKEAESAMLNGRAFQDRLLSVTWCTQQSARGHVMSTVLLRHRSMSLVGGTEEGQLLGDEVEEDEDPAQMGVFSEDLLLQDDEEEEEDEEDKSWRR